MVAVVSSAALPQGAYGEMLPPALAEGGPEEQVYLRQAVAGLRPGDEVAWAIRHLLVEERALLSLRPLGLEDNPPTTFAPVLQYLGGLGWRVGLPKHGRVAFLVASDPADAVAQAQATYAQWCADELRRQG